MDFQTEAKARSAPSSASSNAGLSTVVSSRSTGVSTAVPRLAEFEIEYADKKSDTLDVAFESDDPVALARAFGLSPLPDAKKALAVIWTTTAWTIPANQALNRNPELVYALVDTPRGLLVLAESLVEKCLERYQLSGTVLARSPGKALGGVAFHHPLAHVDPTGYDRLSPVYLADYATAKTVPAWCTPRPPMAWTTSTAAWPMA
jgi:isoleucyl-tRNA synthetase